MAELSVKLEGIVYVDTVNKRGLAVNAERPRVSRTNPMVMIPTHIPFLGVRVDQHDPTNEIKSFIVKRALGSVDPKWVQVYDLSDQYAVSFPTNDGRPFKLIDPALPGDPPQPDPSNNKAFHWVTRMSRLTSKPLRPEALATPPVPVASGFVDLDHSELGSLNVLNPHPYRFLHTDPLMTNKFLAEIITATFTLVDPTPPVIRL